MSEYHRPKLINPLRRLRHYARHTPNGQIALNLMAAGAVLLIVAVILALIVF